MMTKTSIFGLNGRGKKWNLTVPAATSTSKSTWNNMAPAGANYFYRARPLWDQRTSISIAISISILKTPILNNPTGGFLHVIIRSLPLSGLDRGV
jgi:hypothetical protein